MFVVRLERKFIFLKSFLYAMCLDLMPCLPNKAHELISFLVVMGTVTDRHNDNLLFDLIFSQWILDFLKESRKYSMLER